MRVPNQYLQCLLPVDMAAAGEDITNAYSTGSSRSMTVHRRIQFALRQNGVGKSFQGDWCTGDESKIIIFDDALEDGLVAGTHSNLTHYAMALARWAQ